MADWLDDAMTRPGAGRRRGLVVVVLDAALVRQLVEGRRPDILVVDDGLGTRTWAAVEDVIDANLGTRPVYVIRSQPQTSRLWPYAMSSSPSATRPTSTA